MDDQNLSQKAQFESDKDIEIIHDEDKVLSPGSDLTFAQLVLLPNTEENMLLASMHQDVVWTDATGPFMPGTVGAELTGSIENVTLCVMVPGAPVI